MADNGGRFIPVRIPDDGEDNEMDSSIEMESWVKDIEMVEIPLKGGNEGEEKGTGSDDGETAKSKRNHVPWRAFVGAFLFMAMAILYMYKTAMSVTMVAMVNHTALAKSVKPNDDNDCDNGPIKETSQSDGPFLWITTTQSLIQMSLFYGYVITMIPAGILAKRYGCVPILGGGILLSSILSFLIPFAAYLGPNYVMIVRFLQGLAEGPIVPCTYAMIAKWVPQNERSRMTAFVFSGAQVGTIIAMPLSGYLSQFHWELVFYILGLIGIIWSVLFLLFVSEDPESCKRTSEEEKEYIRGSVGRAPSVNTTKTPWMCFITSTAFWGTLIAHLGQNYGYETLMIELPTFMKQVLHFNLKQNGVLSALPYVAMWLISIVASWIADYFIFSGQISRTVTRKLFNSIGQFGPAIALVVAAYTGCSPILTVAVLTIGVGLNGAIYSGFKANHMDISPTHAGILMSLTNCFANLIGLMAPFIAGYIIQGRPTQEAWGEVFFIAAGVYAFCATVFVILGSGERQSWDPEVVAENPDEIPEEEETEL